MLQILFFVNNFDIVIIKTCECVCYDITINTDSVFIVVHHQANHCIILIVFCF